MAHDNAVWKKALWKRRSNNLHKLPDNHTSSRFLEDLVLNANAVPRDVVTVMCDAQVVVHQLSLTGLFAATHAHLRSNLVSGRTILFISTLLLVAATTACFLLDPAYANAFTTSRASRDRSGVCRILRAIIQGCPYIVSYYYLYKHRETQKWPNGWLPSLHVFPRITRPCQLVHTAGTCRFCKKTSSHRPTENFN